MKIFFRLSTFRDQRGAVAIIVALTIFVLVGLAAFAIDISNIHVARAELQNAADAGALAGGRVLYLDDSQASVNTGCNLVAYDAATANESQNESVEVDMAEVQRGHWSFATRTFTPNDSTAQVDLWNVSTEELDADINFINAIRVVTRRQATPVASFFARIFGRTGFQVSAQAVGYIGFAGTLDEFDVDQPIAICKQSMLQDGAYSCNIGRMINSGQNVESHETGGWSSFNQDDPCSGGTNANEVRDLVCGDGNPDILQLGGDMATNGGQIQSAFSELIECWNNNSAGNTQPWNLTLPVIDCPGNNVSTCEELLGAVNVNVVWITGPGTPSWDDAPTQMAGIENVVGDWSSSASNGEERWNSFVDHFNLKNVDGTDAPYNKKSIYFLPDCTPHEPMGVSGGENFGILADIPVLVE